MVQSGSGSGLTYFGSIFFGRGAAAPALQDDECLVLGLLVGTGLDLLRALFVDLTTFVDLFLVFLSCAKSLLGRTDMILREVGADSGRL